LVFTRIRLEQHSLGCSDIFHFLEQRKKNIEIKRKRGMSCGRHFNWSVTYFSWVRYIARFLFLFLKAAWKKKKKGKSKHYKS